MNSENKKKNGRKNFKDMTQTVKIVLLSVAVF